MNISIQQQTIFYIETLIELPCQLVRGYYLIKHHRYILEGVNGAVKRAHIPAYSQLHQLALLPTHTTGKNQCLSHGGCERIGCLSPILLKASQLKKSSSRGFQLYERLRWVAGVKRLKWCSIYGMIMFIRHYFRVREYATVILQQLAAKILQYTTISYVLTKHCLFPHGSRFGVQLERMKLTFSWNAYLFRFWVSKFTTLHARK